jgi:hypothetical protein
MKFPVFIILTLAALITGLQAQPAAFQPPRIGYVYPAGAARGTSVRLIVGGQYLKDVSAVQVSGKGVTAHLLDYQHPLNQQEMEAIKEEAAKLREKRKAVRGGGAGPDGKPLVWTPEDDRRGEYLRSRLEYRQNRQAAPAISEAQAVELTIAPDAEPGRRELRLSGGQGASNPLNFEIGLLPEFSEPAADPNTALPMQNDGSFRLPRGGGGGTVTLPVVANGQILPGEVDRLRFHASKGCRLLVAVEARALIPYLADAVPGWFQATASLEDASGRELAYADDYRFNPDPVLFYEIPAEGDYALVIKDALFRGRQDFVYRVTIGELPFVSSVWPLGGAAGQSTTVELRGWNLPARRAVIDDRSERPGIRSLRIVSGHPQCNEVLFDGGAAGIPEREPDDSIQHPMTIPVGTTVDGHIDQPGDRDVYAFQGRAGAVVVAETFARRLNSPLDSSLTLSDASGRQLAFNDDHEDKGSGLSTHHADSRLQAVLPADGTYYLTVADVQGRGGPEYAYRLVLGAPAPDFELRVVPSTVNVRSGFQTPVTVYALRKDGFGGEIRLGLAGAPEGFVLSGAVIPAGQDKVRLTLGSTLPARDAPVLLSLEGRAQIGGKTVSRDAVPAEDMMQAFAYRHLVPAQSWYVQVFGKTPPRAALRVLEPTSVAFEPGKPRTVEVEAALGGRFDELEFSLSEPPDGLALRVVGHQGSRWSLELVADPARFKPGLAGNLLIQVSGHRANAAKDKPKPKKGPEAALPLGVLPALPFTFSQPRAREAVAPAI